MARTHTKTATHEPAHRLTRALGAALVLLALAATALVGQQAPRTLSLAEAVELAKRNNPGWLSTRNDQEAADWQVREAYASLLPTAYASGSMTYQEPGVQRIGTFEFGSSTDYLFSGYSVDLNWSFDGGSLFAVSAARAGREATAARIRSAEFDLESSVTLQYMSALRARDGADVAERQLDRARQNYDLAKVRADAGAVPMTDAKTAQVQLGRAEVAFIQAERGYRSEILRLTQQLGVELQGEVDLVTGVEPFEPTFALDDLLEQALSAHPALRSAQARDAAGRAQLRQARTGYLPSVSVSTGFSGRATEQLDKDLLVSQAEQSLQNQRSSCEQQNLISAGLSRPLPGYPKACASGVLSAADRADLVSGSEVFPFDFTDSPLQLSLQVSVPLFNGFATQRQVEQSAAAAKDASEDLRAQELRLRADVTQAFDNLTTQYRLIELERGNRAIAEEQLALARQRYALGASSILELLDAQTSLQTADRDYLNALYGFQINLAVLEAASGVRLRPTS